MPETFYDMEIDDFLIMQKGYFNQRKADDMRFAKVGFYIAAIHQNGLAGKPLFSSKFFAEWLGEKPPPLSKDELDKRSADIMKRVRHTNKILEEKEKKNKSIQPQRKIKKRK